MEDSYYISCINETVYAASTIRVTRSHINKLKQICVGQTLHQIIHSPDKTQADLDNAEHLTTISTGTKKLIIDSIIRIIVNSTLKNTDIHNKWNILLYRTSKEIDEQNKLAKLDGLQTTKYVLYEDVIKKIESLPDDSTDKLLLMMYTLIPPVVAEYWSAEIINDESNVKHGKNYILLNDEKQQVILNERKAINGYYQYRYNLPNDLVKIIKLSLQKFPRNHLFVSSKDNNSPYKIPNRFIGWAGGRLKNLFSKGKISLTTLRYTYLHRKDVILPRMQENSKKILCQSVSNGFNPYFWVPCP